MKYKNAQHEESMGHQFIIIIIKQRNQQRELNVVKQQCRCRRTVRGLRNVG